MSRRGSYRRHSAEFKLQVCTDIRVGKLGRLESQKLYKLSANLIQHWLVQYDHGELTGEEFGVAHVAEYQSQIAALERKVGQLTMEIDLLKKYRGYDPRGEQRCLLDRERPQGCSIRQGCEMIDLPQSTY